MIRSIIVARADNGVIGRDNDLVWHLPADQKYFRRQTMSHFIIMGRKTLESLEKPLPGRTSIVVTRNRNYKAEGSLIFHSLQDAFALAEQHQQQEVFILGGGEIYRQSMDLADRIYLTEVKANFDGDTYFPEIDPGRWKEISREEHQPDEKNPYPYHFVVLEKHKI